MDELFHVKMILNIVFRCEFAVVVYDFFIYYIGWKMDWIKKCVDIVDIEKKILVSFSDEIFLFSSEWWIIAYKDYDFEYFTLMRVDNDRVRIFDLLYQMKYGYENFRWMSLMLKNNMKDNPFQLKVFVQ